MIKAKHCDCNAINEIVVKRIKKKIPQEEKLYDLADFFKIFGDSARIKIIWALMQSEMCVCDLSALLNRTKSAISHQVRVLRQARLVKYKKLGKTVVYSLSDSHIRKVFEQGFEHINE
jgi:ArsR family transcriptional regulator